MGHVKYVTRTWKKSGDKNVMSMEAACNNLEVNSERPLHRKEIARLLSVGRTICTPLAKFKLS